jgi:hypothetical protein
LSWCSFRLVVCVGVIVRNQRRVPWNGIPHHMVIMKAVEEKVLLGDEK